MSYILDALRRAESERERERDGVPGLNAQPIPVQSDRPPRRRHRPWIWVAAGLGLGLLLPFTWHLLADDESVQSPEAIVQQERAAVVAAAPVQSPAPPPPAPAPAIAPAAAPPADEPASAAPSAAALPARAAASRAGAAASASRPAVAKASAPAATARKPPPRPEGTTRAKPAAQSAPETPVPKLAELPDELRRSVPPLAFGGAVYSEVPAQRMVILNGQLLREGEALSADLTLETIRAKSAVLRIKGERFELVF
jgi:general secretion pathway protein B